jgi:hypothetical protein
MAPQNPLKIAQNGVLIGQTAADCAIDKIKGTRTSIVRALIPTQLVIRNSCGEGRSLFMSKLTRKIEVLEKGPNGCQSYATGDVVGSYEEDIDFRILVCISSMVFQSLV